MFTVNPNWNKWILISVIKHFQVLATTNDWHFPIPGTISTNSIHDRFFELKLDGPKVTQLSRDYFRLLFGVNILYSTDIETNYQDDVIMSGLIAEAFSEICVYKWGDGDEYLGRFTPIKDTVVNNFGIVKDTRIKQGSIESVYEIYLEN